MSTSIREAIKLWESRNGKDATKAKEIGFQFMWPPIEEMDDSLDTLSSCEQLSLSNNLIEKINGISSLKNLKILSLARNNLKSIAGIETLADTLEQLWVSYNLIEKIRPLESMTALRVFSVSNNLIKEWVEFNRMAVPPKLTEITFVGNPLQESAEDPIFREEAIRRLPNLKKLNGQNVIRI